VNCARLRISPKTTSRLPGLRLPGDGRDDPEEIERLSRRALSHDPECVDALRMMAFVTAKSPRERIAMLANAVQAGERALVPTALRRTRPFLGVLETRPYMRARYDLATALLREGETDEAVGHLEALLDLNEHDNQGVRYDLLPVIWKPATSRNRAAVRRVPE